jgi:hypothetical protein
MRVARKRVLEYGSRLAIAVLAEHPTIELVIRVRRLLVPFPHVQVLLKRDVGAVGIADILLLVLVADAAQNAMASIGQ